MHICFVKLESGGQQLPVIKKNLSRNSFNLEKSSFSLKLLKTYVFTQITMLNSYTFALSRIKSKSLGSTIHKRKKTLHTLYSLKKIIFLSKKKNNKKILFDLKCTILNRYTYESRNIEMINSEVTKNYRKFFYIPYLVWNWHFNQKYWKFTFFTKYIQSSKSM